MSHIHQKTDLFGLYDTEINAAVKEFNSIQMQYFQTMLDLDSVKPYRRLRPTLHFRPHHDSAPQSLFQTILALPSIVMPETGCLTSLFFRLPEGESAVVEDNMG